MSNKIIDLLHNKNANFITIGEIMLRLTPPDYIKIRTADVFKTNYGGSEASIALSLSNLGIDSTFFSAVPNNSIGKAAIRWVRSNDIHCTPVIRTTKQETPTHRLGIYYYEQGFGIRAGKVTYDRKNSAFSEYDYSNYDFENLLKNYSWLHLSGITHAINENCKNILIKALKAAKKLGLIISFDGNYRSELWPFQDAKDFCTTCLPYVDVLFGIEPYNLYKDDNDKSSGDFKDDIPYQPNLDEQKFIFEKFHEKYPNIKVMARNVRYVYSGSDNSLKAYIWYDGETFESNTLRFNILDRVGGGDAFAAGLIYAIFKNYEVKESIDFAVSLSALKHTIMGDGNITDDLDSVHDLMNMSFEISIFILYTLYINLKI